MKEKVHDLKVSLKELTVYYIITLNKVDKLKRRYKMRLGNRCEHIISECFFS